MRKKVKGMEELTEKEQRKFYLLIFLLMFPSFLIAITSAVGNIAVRITLIVLLIIFQFAMIKNFAEEYYFL